MNRLKNITVIELVVILLSAFFIFAAFDIYRTIKTHQQYDMDGLLKEIQQEYPKSRLSFHNIIVEGNFLKTRTVRRAHPPQIYDEEYYIINYYKIKDGKLTHETNYLYLLFLFAPIMFIIILNDKFTLIKVREIHTLNSFTIVMIIASCVILAFVFLGHDESNILNLEYINILKYKL